MVFPEAVLSAIHLVFENKGLIGVVRASFLKNKELRHFALDGQAVVRDCRLRTIAEVKGQIAEVRTAPSRRLRGWKERAKKRIMGEQNIFWKTDVYVQSVQKQETKGVGDFLTVKRGLTRCAREGCG